MTYVLYLYAVHFNKQQLGECREGFPSNGTSGIHFDTFFEYDTDGRTRGHSNKLCKKRFNTDFREYFFTDRIINIWNALDDRTVTSATLNSFENGLKRLRKSKQIGLLWSSVAKEP